MNYCHRRESHVHVPLKRPSSSATGEGDDPLSSLQQLQIQCEEWIDYLRSQHLSEPFLLSELEVILDSGNLDVYISFCSKPTTLWWVHVLFLNSSFQHCFCRINGVDYSIPHTLMKQSLVKVMFHQCGFKHRPNRLLGRHVPPNPGHIDLECQFYMQKALTNTPLTYLLGQPTSHGKLQSLCIKVEIEAKNILLLPEDIVQSFQINEDIYGIPTLSEANQAMETSLDHAFSTLFCHHLGAKYPLIFSQSYVEKLTNNTKHIPTVARSLQRTMITSGAASRTVFNDKATDYLQITQSKIKALQTNYQQQRQEHGIEDREQNHIWNDLVIATYYSTKRSDSLRRHRTTFTKANSSTNATQTSTSSSWDSVVSSTTTNPSEDTLQTSDASQDPQHL